MQKIITCFILLLTQAVLTAQQPVQLEGRIIADSLEYTFINILNISAHKGTTNDREGRFIVEVNENDTLQFSSVQFQKKEVVITKSILASKFLEVILVPGVNQLDEVYISNSNLVGDLGKDFSKIQFYDKYELDAPQLKQDIPSLIDRKIAATGGDPSNLLLNTISGDRQRLKKIKANMDYDSRIEKALLLLPPEFFKTINIKKTEQMLFLYFCAEDSYFETLVNFERKGDLVVFLKEKSLAWQKRTDG
ncbi:hypothetical protein [Zunongwangia endophytica]|uniref:CarboxypepD_reg-like domain-containing protein n=1 Tax=Zunongwangia endophytica TaxID=1808945 RepID=A0ABV8H5L2_9FLAO|nr:hypothetical protein [Zunongwangia endophytica]MDN3596520.1 hypothetical protein [Zunongwangia endophytica]